jgi:hypothetical protein
MVAISAALERGWPNGLAATEVCRAPGWLDSSLELMAPGKLVAEAGGTPKKNGWEVETMLLVALLLLLHRPLTSNPYKRFEAESADLQAVVTETTVDGVVVSPVKTGALVE